MENSTTPQDSAAMPPASAGSVAWAVMRVGGRFVSIHATKDDAESSRRAFERDENWAHDVVTLYGRPQPTLTDAEREAIHRLIEDYEQNSEPASERCVATLRGLLERTK